jgi:hypothetical protein
MSGIALDAALALAQEAPSWQGSGDSDTLYILIASLVLSVMALIVLMRVRW